MAARCPWARRSAYCPRTSRCTRRAGGGPIRSMQAVREERSSGATLELLELVQPAGPPPVERAQPRLDHPLHLVSPVSRVLDHLVRVVELDLVAGELVPVGDAHLA